MVLRSKPVLRESTVPVREADVPVRSRPARSLAATGRPADVVQMFQRTAGNGAVAALLAPPAPSNTALALQRELWTYQGEEHADLHAIAEKVQRAVDKAVSVIASDPTLKDVIKNNGSGYLSQWAVTYAGYLAAPTAVPEFYHARYGYAVETVATHLLARENIAPYKFVFQVAHGHSRPDIVVTRTDGTGVDREMAWIDITSEASRGHIFDKQHSGWISRAYVAEACYTMPLPSALAHGAGGLTEESRKLIEDATEHAVQQEDYFETARQTMLVEIREALRDTPSASTSRLQCRRTIVTTLGTLLGRAPSPTTAKSVLFLLDDEIPVGRLARSAQDWANWAFGPKVRVKTVPAKSVMIAYGKSLDDDPRDQGEPRQADGERTQHDGDGEGEVDGEGIDEKEYAPAGQ